MLRVHGTFTSNANVATKTTLVNFWVSGLDVQKSVRRGGHKTNFFWVKNMRDIQDLDLDNVDLNKAEETLEKIQRKVDGLTKKETHLEKSLEDCNKPCEVGPLNDVRNRLKEQREGLAMWQNIQEMLSWKVEDKILCIGSNRRGYRVFDFMMRNAKANGHWYGIGNDYNQFLEIKVVEVRENHQIQAKSLHGRTKWLGFPTKAGEVEFYRLVQ